MGSISSPPVNITEIGGRIFSGFSATNFTTASATTRATKGIIFTPEVDLTVEFLQASIEQDVAANTYVAQIAEMTTNAISTANAVVALLGTSAQVQSTGIAGNNSLIYQMQFAPALELTAGTPYLLASVRDDGLATSILKHDQSNTSMVNAPGITERGQLEFASIGVVAAQTANTALVNNTLNIGIRGSLT